MVFQPLLAPLRIGVFNQIAASPRFQYVFCFGQKDRSPEADASGPAIRFRRIFHPARSFSLPGVSEPFVFQSREPHAVLDPNVDAVVLSSDLHILSFVLASLLARLTNKAVVHWGRGVNAPGPTAAIHWRVRRFLNRFADAILLPGLREYHEYARRGEDMTKVFIAHNALDTRQARQLRQSISPAQLADFRAAHGLVGRNVLIYSGPLTKAARVGQLLAAMPMILRKLPAARLVILGDGPLAPVLRRQRDRLGLGEAVDFARQPRTEELRAQYFLTADLALCAGPVGDIVNQTFVYGLPVLASDDLWLHGPEVGMIEPGVTGQFFRDNDILSLADHAARLIADGQGARMRQACIDLIDKQYNETSMADCFEAAVDFALRRKGRI